MCEHFILHKMGDSSLTKEKIMQMMKENDARLGFAKLKTSSSQVSLAFSHVYIDNVKQGFVSCDVCKEVLHHKSIDGTSSMMKHQRSCAKNKKNIDTLTIKGYFRPKTSQSIPKKVKEKVTAATVEFIAVDNRALALISGDGFRNLAQTIFTLGQDLYKVHNVSVLDLFPAPSTVSKYYST